MPFERLWYETGNEHNPTDPYGRVRLDLSADGTLRLDRFARDGRGAWTARTPEDYCGRVSRALVVAGFPAAPTLVPPAGSTMRALRVTGQTTATVLVPWSASLPGYDDLFGLLDALVGAVTGLPRYPAVPGVHALEVVAAPPG